MLTIRVNSNHNVEIDNGDNNGPFLIRREDFKKVSDALLTAQENYLAEVGKKQELLRDLRHAAACTKYVRAMKALRDYMRVVQGTELPLVDAKNIVEAFMPPSGSY